MVCMTLVNSELPYAKVVIIKLFTEILVSLFLHVSMQNVYTSLQFWEESTKKPDTK